MNMISDLISGSNPDLVLEVTNFNPEITTKPSELITKTLDDSKPIPQTDGSISTGTYNTKKDDKNEDFKTFLDSYEQNISKAILIDEMQDTNSSFGSSNYKLFVSNFNDNEKEYYNKDIDYDTKQSAEFNSEKLDNNVNDDHSYKNNECLFNSNKLTSKEYNNEITIRDISNPNYESNHSEKKIIKTSRNSRNSKIMKANSNINCKESGIFDYQSSKDSKYSQKDENKSKSSKRTNKSIKNSQKQNSKRTNKNKTSNCPKPNQFSQGNNCDKDTINKKRSEYLKFESDKPLEVIKEHHSEIYDNLTPAKNDLKEYTSKQSDCKNII